MEVYADDRQFPNGVVLFPDNYLTPFPENGRIDCDDRTANFRPPPPQKLRPIRCIGRSFTDYSDPESRELSGALASCYGAELDFLTQKPSVVHGGGHMECENTVQTYIENRAFPANGDSDGAAAALKQVKWEMDAEITNLISSERPNLEAELSSSSDDGSESSEALKEPINRKRKRKRRRKIRLFLESMMMKVVEKQEEMYNQLIEMLEKNEKERIIKEEAWKRQEIERAKRDEELRAQERSRNLALISFVQNLLGQEIQIPKASKALYLEKESEINYQEDTRCDSGNRRWPKSEVEALLTVRTALDHKFQNGPKSSVWEEVAVELSKMGYNRTARKCKEKWENINKYYKKTMEGGKKRPDYSKSCANFRELDALYRSGHITSGNAINYLKNEI